MINNKRYQMIYENLQTLCYNCGRVDHITPSCPLNTSMENNVDPNDGVDSRVSKDKEQSHPNTNQVQTTREPEPEYGLWLLMKRSRKKKTGPSQTKLIEKENSVSHGRTFASTSRTPMRDANRVNSVEGGAVKGGTMRSKRLEKVSQNQFAVLSRYDKENSQATPTWRNGSRGNSNIKEMRTVPQKPRRDMPS